MREIKGILYTEAFRFTAGTVALEGDRIVSVTPCGEAELTPGERERYILPGLVDIHLHGCAGRDFCEGTAEAFRVMAAYELEHGVTTICPATMTLPEEQLGAVCASCAQAVRVETLSAGIALGDVIRGIYLEGPFIAAKKKGAQNAAYIRLPDAGLLSRLQAAADGMIRMVTIAPEMPGALDCIAENADAFHFSIAHTCADYDTARAAIRAGAPCAGQRQHDGGWYAGRNVCAGRSGRYGERLQGGIGGRYAGGQCDGSLRLHAGGNQAGDSGGGRDSCGDLQSGLCGRAGG